MSRLGRRPLLRRIAARIAAVALVLPLALPRPGAAHDIPDEVRIPVFVREQDGELTLVARVPLLLLLSLNVPKWGAGYLDLERSDPVLRRAGEAFAAEAPLFHPDGSRLPPTLAAFRVALPWDRSFTSFEAALEAVSRPPLSPDTQVFWNQGFLDLHLTYPAPAAGSVSIECGVAPGFGDRVALDVIYQRPEPDTGEWRENFFHISVREGRVALDPSPFQAMTAFGRSGVEHILTGWDHLLFLICLIAPFGRLDSLRRLLLIVTGFTVAHSVTLVAAALGHAPEAPWFVPLVEAVVALSILYTAAENLIAASVGRRAVLAFLFGLFHGFGFAFALGESPLVRRRPPPAGAVLLQRGCGTGAGGGSGGGDPAAPPARPERAGALRGERAPLGVRRTRRLAPFRAPVRRAFPRLVPLRRSAPRLGLAALAPRRARCSGLGAGGVPALPPQRRGVRSLRPRRGVAGAPDRGSAVAAGPR